MKRHWIVRLKRSLRLRKTLRTSQPFFAELRDHLLDMFSGEHCPTTQIARDESFKLRMNFWVLPVFQPRLPELVRLVGNEISALKGDYLIDRSKANTVDFRIFFRLV